VLSSLLLPLLLPDMHSSYVSAHSTIVMAATDGMLF
jgi:hypothetical protein